MPDTLPPETDPPDADHAAWVRPGAVFLEDGETRRITRIADGIVRGVTSTNAFWSWPLPDFLEAARSGRIRPSDSRRPRRPPAPPKPHPHRSAASRQRFEEIRQHPLIVAAGDGLPRLVLETLRALRRGERAGLSALRTLLLSTEAGAEIGGVGRSVAALGHKGGRRSGNAAAAREIQDLLWRFPRWLDGEGEFPLADFRRVQALAELGAKAIRFPDLVPPADPGRPRGDTFLLAQSVRARLACHWHDVRRGSYRLGDAIREIAEEDVLHARKAATIWQGGDPEQVALGEADAEDLRLCRIRIKAAYHRHFPMPLTPEECRGYRQIAATVLKATRRASR
ncbi:Hypothetical protein RMHFA_04727 (plasmid) [Roseomonas mucosa]|uniref:hypothetical protein n=1 Tax=Roseomonas TaxID=125216 RepID=UPI000C190E5F|nr:MULTISPECIES: hypothetical protein [Roseomonas]ATR19457.1 hypothetical protein CTJ15_03600 [Roseomonas sp. FDAARGOS_362]UZO94986.1 Hypothetical protein RMHFA_04727 [Roseomonas mucosa]